MTRRYVALLWLLSGLPLGLALMLVPRSQRYMVAVMVVVLDMGHSLSPITLAWTHSEFRRQVIYPQLRKFLLWPAVVLLGATTIGALTQMGWTTYHPGPMAYRRITGLDNPFPLLVWAYSAWNLYHFVMQDFGVLIFCTGREWRQAKRAACFVGLLGFYFAFSGIDLLGFWSAAPLIHVSWWSASIPLAVISINHWITDIGMSYRVSRHGLLFVGGILLAGTVGFTLVVPTQTGNTMIRMIPILVCVRLGVGIVHFLYSRWVWQLGNPLVRATIGRALTA